MTHEVTLVSPLGDWVDVELARPGWQRRAACRGKGTDRWFSTIRGSDEAACAVCEACPVRRQCLSYALAFPEPLQGVWAGTNEEERALMRRASA